MNKKTRERLRIAWILSLLLIFGLIAFISGYRAFHSTSKNTKGLDLKVQVSVTKGTERLKQLLGKKVKKKYLTVNKYSRPGTPLSNVKSVVIHYTANPGASAMANRNYFNNLPNSNTHLSRPIYASSNYIVGLQGEILNVVPPNEMAYASNYRNKDSISIECCHEDSTGKFNDSTYQSAVWLTARICKAYDLGEDDIIRHHDVSGKNCPKYFVEHEDEWVKFKQDVMSEIKRIPDKFSVTND
jgi:N-acetylmuramoyl-L-alanine amidase CwlA